VDRLDENALENVVKRLESAVEKNKLLSTEQVTETDAITITFVLARIKCEMAC
jgi:hypothetical protein